MSVTVNGCHLHVAGTVGFAVCVRSDVALEVGSKEEFLFWGKGSARHWLALLALFLTGWFPGRPPSVGNASEKVGLRLGLFFRGSFNGRPPVLQEECTAW